MGALEPWHLIVILVIALIVFGPGRLTEIGGTMGKAVRDFREATEGRPTSTTPTALPPAEPAKQTCSSCGATVEPDAKFCAKCGNPLGSGTRTN
jgi:sec-independent protein translocase protein TatA